MSKIISGTEIAEKEIYSNLGTFRDRPILVIFFNRNDSIGQKYIKAKEKGAKKAKIKIDLIPYPKSQSGLEKEIIRLNKDPKITGIVLQLPLPKNIGQEVVYLLNDLKDVDGFYSKFFVPPVARAVKRVLKEIPLWQEKRILIVGQGEFVGKKIYHFLSRENQKIVTALSPKVLKLLLKKNEIIISCVGKPNLIKANKIDDVLALIDVGTSDVEGKLIGDIEKKAYPKAQMVAPVPGGIGPLTIAYLMDNVWQASARQKEI